MYKVIDADDLTERFAIMTIDGNWTDGEALDELKRLYPYTLESGAYSEFLKMVRINTHPAKENATGGQYQGATPDYSTLAQYINAGFSLYSQKEGDGNTPRYFIDWRGKITQYAKGAKRETAKITTLDELEKALANGAMLFSFRPAEIELAGRLLVIDIDRHEGKEDGLTEFYSFLDEIKERDRPTLRDISGGSFPVYTESPSGGFHLYFRTRYVDDLRPPRNITPSVEVKAGNLDITAAGSVKQGRQYIMHGRLTDAPDMPLYLLSKIQRPKPQPIPQRKKERPGDSYNRPRDYSDKLELLETWSLENATRWGIDTGTKHGQVLAFSIQCRNRGVPEEICKDYAAKFAHKEYKEVVRSVYRGR